MPKHARKGQNRDAENVGKAQTHVVCIRDHLIAGKNISVQKPVVWSDKSAQLPRSKNSQLEPRTFW